MQKKDLPAIRFDRISQLGLNRELPFLHTGFCLCMSLLGCKPNRDLFPLVSFDLTTS